MNKLKEARAAEAEQKRMELEKKRKREEEEAKKALELKKQQEEEEKKRKAALEAEEKKRREEDARAKEVSTLRSRKCFLSEDFMVFRENLNLLFNELRLHGPLQAFFTEIFCYFLFFVKFVLIKSYDLKL